jgi:sugar-specific transcriptional regulator TrmB
MSDLDQLLEDLQLFGFTEYESRLYIALLRKNPINRHQLSKLANIPTAKVYETIDRLVRKGIVAATDASDRPTYVPLPPEEVTRQIRSNAEHKLQSVEARLRTISAQTENDVRPLTWNLEGFDRVLAKAREVIDRSRQYVMCAMWDHELQILLPGLRGAQERGVEIVLLVYGEAPADLGIVHEHGKEAVLLEQTGGRWLSVAAEAAQEVIIGFFPPTGPATGVWAQSTILSMIVQKYIREHFLSHGIDLFQLGR